MTKSSYSPSAMSSTSSSAPSMSEQISFCISMACRSRFWKYLVMRQKRMSKTVARMRNMAIATPNYIKIGEQYLQVVGTPSSNLNDNKRHSGQPNNTLSSLNQKFCFSQGDYDCSICNQMIFTHILYFEWQKMCWKSELQAKEPWVRGRLGKYQVPYVILIVLIILQKFERCLCLQPISAPQTHLTANSSSWRAGCYPPKCPLSYHTAQKQSKRSWNTSVTNTCTRQWPPRACPPSTSTQNSPSTCSRPPSSQESDLCERPSCILSQMDNLKLPRMQLIIRYSFNMQKTSLYLITGNAKKLEEFKLILGDEFDFKNENVDLPELQGEPEEVALEKVKIAYEQTKKAVLVEDTSLCFNAYKGLPGPYIKWFLKSVGPEGLAKMVQPFEDKTGYAMCIIAYMSPDLQEPKLFIGKTPGTIVEPRGSRDFGWDPVFQPEGYTETYAELAKETKNTISHRFRAIEEMRKYFSSLDSKTVNVA